MSCGHMTVLMSFLKSEIVVVNIAIYIYVHNIVQIYAQNPEESTTLNVNLTYNGW